MKIDYDQIAHRYDKCRGGDGPYLPVLLRLARASDARRVVEIGPGTGNNTEPFLTAHPCELIGVELSRGMIEQARAKGIAARWVRGSASALPLRSASTDFVFAVYVLHHVPDLDQMFAECFRVLHSGYAAFVTASTEFIERHPMNHYFPSFAAIDKARFQPLDAVAEALGRAGFTDVSTERLVAPPRPIDRIYADSVANRFVSTYDLLPRDEFKAGLARLYADIEADRQPEKTIAWESAVVSGRKGNA
ncbi:MAG: hypothetical protein QG656_1780 [Candidatus Hydrogenedentes bacterium]|nr:hypothetical protein [Candidatus Hydrogenedentota bacterium]